ncbi:hypothetical protein Nepgr_003951 [Nepenthes gracilis]|uniref:Uncharacterized protein n=1 Tax=Nepenthes gracilis TaxID=150966 RepID=A0AAD3XEI0_NEPGR|nr:hypothetical protein Nepgr_003951 [Nepenthes gracilis]
MPDLVQPKLDASTALRGSGEPGCLKNLNHEIKTQNLGSVKNMEGDAPMALSDTQCGLIPQLHDANSAPEVGGAMKPSPFPSYWFGLLNLHGRAALPLHWIIAAVVRCCWPKGSLQLPYALPQTRGPECAASICC